MINKNNLSELLFKISFYLFVFCISFSSSLKLTNLLTFPLLMLFVSFILYFFIFNFNKNSISFNINLFFENKLLFLIILFQSLHLLFSSQFEATALRHFFIFNFLLFFFIQVIPNFYSVLKIKSIFKINFYSVLLISLVALMEFILNFYGIKFTDFLFRAHEITAYFHEGDLIVWRSVAFSSEPIQLGYYLLSMGPLVFLIHSQYKKFFSYILLFIFLATLTTLSAVSLSILFINSIILLFLLLYYQLYKPLIYILSFFMILFLCIYSTDYFFVVNDILNKISFDNEFTSVSQRINLFKIYFEFFAENPFFGVGAGYFSLHGYPSAINFYLTFLATYGVFQFVLLILLFLAVYYKFLINPHHDKITKILFSFSYLNSCLFLFFLSTYWNLFHLFLISLLIYLANSNGKVFNQN